MFNKELKEWILSFVILILRHYKVVQFPIKFSWVNLTEGLGAGANPRRTTICY
jgi:hypothetical protein